MKRSFLGVIVVLAICLAFVTQAGAESIKLTIKPGWNLLNLPIEADNKSPASVLSGLNYASVWSWNASESKWRVYLSKGDEATQSYATGKGFDVVSSIYAGEGFWVNSSENTEKEITVQGSKPTNDKHDLVKGWNLIGLKSDQQTSVSAILNVLNQQGINAVSLWSWDSTNAKWNVYIPSFKETDLTSYVNTKGFKILSTISSTDGFWVNASTGGSVTETPPQVGKAYKATGDNTYIPLANADVYVNGEKIGTTDSNGNFKLPENLAANAIITIGSGAQFTISASELKGGGLYLFAQDQDKNKVLLKASEEGQGKPTPKKISSGDGKASITVTDLKLTKDITVAVTPYKTPISPPNVAKVKALDPKFMVVAGADVSFVDSKGKNISIGEAGFQGKVVPQAKNFLGEFTGEALYKYLGGGDETAPPMGSLWLLAYENGAYTVVGEAQLLSETTQQKTGGDTQEGKPAYYLAPAPGVQIVDKLVPFLFVFKQEYLMGELEVTVTNAGILYKKSSGDELVTEGTEGKGAVIDESYGQPVKGALVLTDNSDEFAVTGPDGKAKVKYILPFDNPNLGIIVKKDGYFDGTTSFNVLEEGQKTVNLAELPDTAAVGGVVYDSTKGKAQGGIAGAKVTLKNPIVLDKIVDDGETITVGLDPDATYKWEVKKQGEGFNWFTVDEGKAHYTLTKTQVKKKLIDDYNNLSEGYKAKLGANPVGTYDVRITVTHPFSNYTYVESAEGYLDITIDMAKLDETASLAQGKLGEVSVFGGKDLGFYYATAPVTSGQTYTWTVFINSWDDANGDGQADEGEIETLAKSEAAPIAFFPFIEAINLVQKNYLKLLVPPENGWKDPNVAQGKAYLEEGVSIKILFEISYPFPPVGMEYKTSYAEFDLKSDDPLSTLIVGKLQIIPNTTMAFEETQTTKEDGSYLFAFVDPQLDGLLGIYANAMAYLPNSIFLGTQYPLLKGWITQVDIPMDPVELPPEPGAEPEPITYTQAAALEWVETWEGALELSNATQISGTAGIWTVGGNDMADVQWWLITNPETKGPAAIPGIDYPVPEGETDAKPNLLPAYQGTNVAWFGSKTTWTFSDSGQNTSNGYKWGTLESPQIDLTAFSFATLEFATWWEVESVDVAKWQFDQMKVQVTVTDITQTTQLGGVTFEPNEWKTVAWLNPDYEVPIQAWNINYSSGGNDAVPIWVKITANLNPFAGHKIKIRFYFDSKDSLFNGFRGWAVDEIKIKNEDSNLPFTTWGEYWWWKPAIRSE